MATKGETFTITKDHLKLLKEMWVEWGGAPMIDCKRPYGNSDIIWDIARILKWKLTETVDGEIITKKQSDFAEQLHRETEKALQICLSTQSFKPGIYEITQDYDKTSWKLKYHS